MAINRTRSWLVALTTTLLLAGTAAAQHQGNPDYANGNAPYSDPAPTRHRPVTPFAPVNFDQDWQLFAPANISEFGNGPKPKIGFFFSYERVFWNMSKPSTADVGDPNQEGVYQELRFPVAGSAVGTSLPVLEQNTITTDIFKSRFGWGNRYDLGYMDDNSYGWLVSILDHVKQSNNFTIANPTMLVNDPGNILFGFRDADGDGIDDDIDGDLIFGRDGADTTIPRDFIPNAPAPVDLGDAIKLFPRFQALEVHNSTTLNGIEVMRMYRLPRLHDNGNFELLYGARYLQVDDKFTLFNDSNRAIAITATGTGAGQFDLRTEGAGVLDQFSLTNRIANNIVGPQLGGRYSHQRGRWIFSAEGRFFAGANFQNARLTSNVATNSQLFRQTITDVDALGNSVTITNYPSNRPNTLLVPYGNTSIWNKEQFAPGGELRLNTAYQVTRGFALKLSYTGLVVDGIARASNHVNYTFPNFSLLNGNNSQVFWAQGLSFGVEFNR